MQPSDLPRGMRKLSGRPVLDVAALCISTVTNEHSTYDSQMQDKAHLVAEYEQGLPALRRSPGFALVDTDTS